MTWFWYTWPTLESFDAWHADACTAIGIPYANYNEATNQVDVGAQWTTAYTSVVRVTDSDWRAIVEDNVAEELADGLGAPCDPPPSPEIVEE